VTADLHGQAGAGPLTAPGVQPGRRLDAVSRLVVDYLRSVSSLDLWAVTRVAQGCEFARQVAYSWRAIWPFLATYLAVLPSARPVLELMFANRAI